MAEVRATDGQGCETCGCEPVCANGASADCVAWCDSHEPSHNRCPDGSQVGRAPENNCEFYACPEPVVCPGLPERCGCVLGTVEHRFTGDNGCERCTCVKPTSDIAHGECLATTVDSNVQKIRLLENSQQQCACVDQDALVRDQDALGEIFQRLAALEKENKSFREAIFGSDQDNL